MLLLASRSEWEFADGQVIVAKFIPAGVFADLRIAPPPKGRRGVVVQRCLTPVRMIVPGAIAMIAIAVIAIAMGIPVPGHPATYDRARSGAYDRAHRAANNRTGCSSNNCATHGASFSCHCRSSEGNRSGQSNNHNWNSHEKSP
jgi:hypothetical protein